MVLIETGQRVFGNILMKLSRDWICTGQGTNTIIEKSGIHVVLCD